MTIRDIGRQKGASAVHWLVALIPLLGFGTLAVDFNNVYVSLGELQNAADAGALEGARLLYNPDGTINIGQSGTSAIDGATSAAQANFSQGNPVEIISVNRGHWEFKTNHTDGLGIERGGVFTANASTTPAPLVDGNGNFRTFQDLNQDPNEVNAVEVVTGRQLTPVQSFFGPVLGISDYQTQARSVAYVGFAGSVDPFEFEVPIAMCQETLTVGCNVGRLVPEPSQTGGWTDMAPNTDGSCGGAVNASETNTLMAQSKVCGGGGINGQEIPLGAEVRVNNGQINSTFTDMHNCWKNNPALDTDTDGWPDQIMTLTLPVVHGCRFGGDCAMIIGGIRVEVLWMFLNDPNNVGVNNIDNTAPRAMGNWSNNDPNGIVRWDDFVQHYQLEMDDAGTPATFANGGAIQKTLYFKPDCDPLTLGGTGGANYGIRAEVPVLVH